MFISICWFLDLSSSAPLYSSELQRCEVMLVRFTHSHASHSNSPCDACHGVDFSQAFLPPSSEYKCNRFLEYPATTSPYFLTNHRNIIIKYHTLVVMAQQSQVTPPLPPRANSSDTNQSIKSIATKVTSKLPKPADIHIPTVNEVLAFSPAKSIYNTVIPYLANKNGELGEDTPQARARSLARVQSVSRWLDAKYKIPFTKYRIGIDPIVSAVPYIGDVVSTALSCYVVYLTRRFHVPWWITAKMVWNVMLNATFG